MADILECIMFFTKAKTNSEAPSAPQDVEISQSKLRPFLS